MPPFKPQVLRNCYSVLVSNAVGLVDRLVLSMMPAVSVCIPTINTTARILTATMESTLWHNQPQTPHPGLLAASTILRPYIAPWGYSY